MKKTKGFVTLATGKEYYYQIAVNLLKSYRYSSKNPLPFTIIASEHNKYTEQFDNVIILENPRNTFVDKIELANNIPYDETIFLEPDCLAYTDLNKYFDLFKDASDFSTFGSWKPIDYEGSYFRASGIGDKRDLIDGIPTFSSGIIYLRKGEYCKNFYNLCKEIEKDYDKYEFINSFGNSIKERTYCYKAKMLDDTIFALSFALLKTKLVERQD